MRKHAEAINACSAAGSCAGTPKLKEALTRTVLLRGRRHVRAVLAAEAAGGPGRSRQGHGVGPHAEAVQHRTGHLTQHHAGVGHAQHAPPPQPPGRHAPGFQGFRVLVQLFPLQQWAASTTLGWATRSMRRRPTRPAGAPLAFKGLGFWCSYFRYSSGLPAPRWGGPRAACAAAPAARQARPWLSRV